MNRVLAHGYRWLDFFVQKPWRGLALLMGLQVLGWGVMATFFNAVPHHDILFNSLVGLYGEDAYEARHPPLVYIVHHWLNMGEGLLPLPHYVVAQLFVIATYGAVYGMGVVLLKNKLQALAATLLLVGLHVYQGYTWVGVNQDVMMYPFWALIPLLTFYATRPLSQDAHQHRWWLLLGFVMGIPIWMKYHIFILLVTVALWILMDKEARAHLATPYPYGALLICLCVAAIPLEQAWQYRHVIEGYGTSYDTENFWWRVIITPKLMLIAVLLAGLISLRTRLTYPFHNMTKRETNFLCLFALMPFVILFLAGVAMNTELKFYWTSSMYPLWSLLLVALVRAGWRHYSTHVILILALAVLLKPIYQHPFKLGFYPRLNNSRAIGEKIIDRWRHQTSNQPLYHIFGNVGLLAGVVALHAGDEARLSHQRNKPADDELLQKQGAFFVFSEDDWHKNRIRQDIKNWQLSEQTMKIDEYPHVIYYAIVPPAEK